MAADIVLWIMITLLTQLSAFSLHSHYPRLLPVNTTVNFHREETATLKCAIDHLGRKTVSWRKLPYITPITTGVTRFAQDSRYEAVHVPWKKQWNLRIKSVQLHDAGVYECQVGTHRKKIRQKITLHVKDAVLYRKADIKITGTQFPEKGGIMFLFCNATGRKHAPNRIDWFKNGERLFSKRLEKMAIKKTISINAGVMTSSLVITDVQPDDNGTYVCRATSLEDETLITSLKVNVSNGGSSYPKRDVTRTDTLESNSAQITGMHLKVGLIYFFLTFVLLVW
ncbi:zwei Ig domain protein zig-8-like [Mytilus galloprovincialis]|uniref:zwei Ig domain protein zig-8-like n=1 Tax=Mytilus galloprovincialis TaxID=29158 RepID=UPI003F7B3CEA